MALETAIPGAVLAGVIRDAAGRDPAEGLVFGHCDEVVGREVGDEVEEISTSLQRTILSSHVTTGGRFSFYCPDGNLDRAKLSELSASRTIVGWFVSSTGGTMNPSVRTAMIHRELEKELGYPLFLLAVAFGHENNPSVDAQLFSQTPSNSFIPSRCRFVISSMQQGSSLELKETSGFFPEIISAPPKSITNMERAVDRVVTDIEARIDDIEEVEIEGAKIDMENLAIGAILGLVRDQEF
jgi:hypothetical protein